MSLVNKRSRLLMSYLQKMLYTHIQVVLHTDASNLQHGAVVLQENCPIEFYSRKLNSAQRRWTTTKKEFSNIVETRKEFRTILLGYEIEIYTGHIKWYTKLY